MEDFSRSRQNWSEFKTGYKIYNRFKINSAEPCLKFIRIKKKFSPIRVWVRVDLDKYSAEFSKIELWDDLRWILKAIKNDKDMLMMFSAMKSFSYCEN